MDRVIRRAVPSPDAPLHARLPVPDPNAHPARVVLRGEPPSGVHVPPDAAFHTRRLAALPQCWTVQPGLISSGDGRMVACDNPF
jgi:peptide/nickel transport system ATP-binding protein